MTIQELIIKWKKEVEVMKEIQKRHKKTCIDYSHYSKHITQLLLCIDDLEKLVASDEAQEVKTNESQKKACKGGYLNQNGLCDKFLGNCSKGNCDYWQVD